jgi:nucleoside-diphosphate-sugar epimerase
MIDVLIVARDRARDLPFCLTTLMGWTGRVFVIDAGSADATADVAGRYGAHVVRRDGADPASHRPWAMENLTWQSPWVLLVGPEEVVTPALRDALKRIAAGTSDRRYGLTSRNHTGPLTNVLTEINGERATRFFPRSRGFGPPDEVVPEPILSCPLRDIGAPPRPRPPGATRESPPGTFAERFGSLVQAGQRVVVTGGSGFIGSNLVEFFHQAGADVVNLDHGPPRSDRCRPLWREVNLLDRERLTAQVRDLQPELFFHLAARTDLDEKHDPAGYAANITGVENVLAAVEGLSSLRRLVVTSTQLVTPLGYRPTHDQDYCPDTVYGQSKVATEVLTRLWDKAPCPWTLVRPTSIWGPGFEEPYRRFFLTLARGRYVHPAGSNPRRSFGFAGNIVYEYVKLSQAPEETVAGRTFYLTDYEPVRVRDWAEVITREMGIKPPRQIPLPVLRAAAKAGDVAQSLGWKAPPLTSFRLRNMLTDSVSETGPLQAVVGPLPYTLEEGVRMTVKWLRDVGLINVPGRDDQTFAPR